MIPALSKGRQKNRDFEVSVGDTVRPCHEAGWGRRRKRKKRKRRRRRKNKIRSSGEGGGGRQGVATGKLAKNKIHE